MSIHAVGNLFHQAFSNRPSFYLHVNITDPALLPLIRLKQDSPPQTVSGGVAASNGTGIMRRTPNLTWRVGLLWFCALKALLLDGKTQRSFQLYQLLSSLANAPSQCVQKWKAREEDFLQTVWILLGTRSLLRQSWLQQYEDR